MVLVVEYPEHNGEVEDGEENIRNHNRYRSMPVSVDGPKDVEDGKEAPGCQRDALLGAVNINSNDLWHERERLHQSHSVHQIVEGREHRARGAPPAMEMMHPEIHIH